MIICIRSAGIMWELKQLPLESSLDIFVDMTVDCLIKTWNQIYGNASFLVMNFWNEKVDC